MTRFRKPTVSATNGNETLSEPAVRDQGGPPQQRWLAEQGNFACASWSPESALIGLRRMQTFIRKAEVTGRFPDA